MVESDTKSRYFSFIISTRFSWSVCLYVRSSLTIACTSCPIVREHKNASTSNALFSIGDKSGIPCPRGCGIASSGTSNSTSSLSMMTVEDGPNALAIHHVAIYFRYSKCQDFASTYILNDIPDSPLASVRL